MGYKEVKVYSTTTCPWCVRVKDFLKGNNIPYQELDVAVDAKARDDIVRRSGQMGVPVTDIDGELVIGFNEAQLKEKLGL